MIRKIMTASLLGVDADFVVVEADLQTGLPGVNVVGLADTTIKEAKERIKSAIVNSGFQFPRRKLTVNLSPAGRPKEGSHFDLPIAVGILGTENNELKPEGFGIIGELSLDGTLRAVRGALPLAIKLREEGVRKLVLPAGNAAEAALVRDMQIYPVKNLKECVDFLSENVNLNRYIIEENDMEAKLEELDYAEVYGQEAAKRALMIAAAGSHGILMMGSPGCGKTMLAKRLPSIMPSMTYDEMLEVAKIYSAAGMIDEFGVGDGGILGPIKRPFRSPHHTITKAALIGGGRIPRPGELSLAHNGVLFLDEFGEYESSIMELLRQPVEDGYIRLDRVKGSVCLPSRVMLVAAANPCKCGYFGDDKHVCSCTSAQLQSYEAKFSGPMLDRIDMHIRVNSVASVQDMLNLDSMSEMDMTKQQDLRCMSSAEMREIVQRTVKIQRSRYKGKNINFNSQLAEADIKKYCRLTPEANAFMEQSFGKMGLSMRTYYKILKVARTIADIDESEEIRLIHVAEAFQYRALEKLYRKAGE